jgi:hypothetical protein
MAQLSLYSPPITGNIDLDNWLEYQNRLLRNYLGLYDDPSEISFLQYGTGAVSRTAQAKLRDIINVLDFGATGNGTTDDKAAIQAGNDAVEAAGGGTLIFPAGTYRIASMPTIDASNVAWVGMNGAKIKTDFNGTLITITGSSGTKIKNITFENLIFIANTSHTSGQLLRIISAQNVLFRSCDFGNGTTSFYQLAQIGDATYADDVVRVHFDRCDFDSTGGGNGIELVSGSICTVDRCFFNGASAATTQALIYQTNGTRNWDGLDFINNTCEQWPSLLVVNGKGLSNVRISGNISDRAESYAIFCQPDATGTAKQFVINNNILYGDTTAGNPYGIYFVATGGGTVEDIIIDGNDLYDFDNRGIYVSAATRAIVKGNILKNCGQSGTPALTIDTGVNIVVSDNIMQDTNGTALMTYGIEWGGSGTNRVKDNNIIHNYLTAAEIGTP